MNALKDFSDEDLQKELDRRFKKRQSDQDRERKAYLGEPSIENYMKARYPDLDRPYFSPFRKWYYENFALQRGLWTGGSYWDDTLQPVIQIALYRDVALKEQLGVLDFVPYIEETDLQFYDERHNTVTKRGKRIDIMEYTLSEFGSYSLLTTGNDVETFLLKNTRTERRFNTLEQALHYVRDNHYYQVKPGRDR